MQTGRYDAALELAEQALAAAEAGDMPKRVLQAWMTLALAQQRSSRTEASVQSYETAYLLAEADGDDWTGFEAAVQLCSLVGHRQGRVDEGENWYEIAQSKRERLGLGTDHLSVAKLNNNHGLILQSIDRHDEAIERFERAISIWEATMGAHHVELWISQNNLANSLYDQARYEEAVAIHQRILEERRELFGANPPDVATTLNNLGNAYTGVGRSREALEAFDEALGIFRRVHGPEHPDVAMVWNNIGMVKYTLGSVQEARAAFERAIAAAEDHRDAAQYHGNLASVLIDLEDYETSVAESRRALELGGPQHQPRGLFTALTLGNLGVAQMHQGNLSGALESYQEALDTLGSVYADHPLAAMQRGNVAEIYRRHGDYAMALEEYRRAISIYDEHEAPPSQGLYDVYQGLATTYRDLGRTEDAIRTLERGVARISALAHSPRTREDIARLESMLEAIAR